MNRLITRAKKNCLSEPWCGVPFGREEQIGVVWRHGKSSGLDDKRIRTVIEKFNFPPIAEELRRLVEFTAAYNCAPLGLVLKMVISVRQAFDARRRPRFTD